MSDIGKPELATQNRFIALFRDELGYPSSATGQIGKPKNNIEEGLLTGRIRLGKASRRV